MEFGQFLKKARKSIGLSQAGVAKKTGVTQAYVSLVESGMQKPSLYFLEIISLELDIPLYLIVYFCTLEKDVSEAAWKHVQSMRTDKEKELKLFLI
jgi:transcriptional regulator with XRE-family HTH domain